MKHLVTSFVVASALLLPCVSFADPPTPGVVILKDTIIVGNPRRPIVTVEVTRQKINVPLHEMKHPLDDRNPTNAAPF